MTRGCLGPGKPSACLVVLCLAAEYATICGLASFLLGPMAVLLSVVLLLAQVMLAAALLNLRHPSVPWLVLLWLATAAVAAVVGAGNYFGSYAPYATAMAGRRYDAVDVASAKASAYLDAGLISFTADAVLDDSLSVGARGMGSTYCAAPILSKSAAAASTAQEQEVQFWAIGTDCCGHRGTFSCGDAAVPTTHGGVAWREPSEDSALTGPLAAQHHERYMAAVNAACAVYGLRTAEEPILLYWLEQPEAAAREWLRRSMLVWLLTSSAAVPVAAAAWCLLQCLFEGPAGRRDEAGLPLHGAKRARPRQTHAS